MPWLFQIASGRISHDGQTIGAAYSGAPGYVDNPADESLVAKGPLPEGWYTFGVPVDSPHTGPFSIPLIPDADNDMYGRGGFFCHGDGINAPPQTSSEGCIVALRSVREQMDYSRQKGDARLQVVSGEPQQFPAIDPDLGQ
jgi:hypothetical protein